LVIVLMFVKHLSLCNPFGSLSFVFMSQEV